MLPPVLPPEHRCRTGGGGAVVEALIALATLGSAALAALVIARPVKRGGSPEGAEETAAKAAPPGEGRGHGDGA